MSENDDHPIRYVRAADGIVWRCVETADSIRLSIGDRRPAFVTFECRPLGAPEADPTTIDLPRAEAADDNALGLKLPRRRTSLS